jgi:hypothetical protein
MASAFFLTIFQHSPQFNTGYCFGCRVVVTESHHMAHLAFNKTMVGLDNIIDIFALPNFDSSIVLSVVVKIAALFAPLLSILIRLGFPLRAIIFVKNRLAAFLSRFLVSKKSMVSPCLSTAQ